MDLPSSPAPDFSASAPLAATTALLEALPWGVLVLDAQGIIQHINQQAATWCGLAAAALQGRPLAEAPLPPALGAVLQQLQPEAPPLEIWLPSTQQWLGLRTTPDPAGSHWIFCDNLTARKQAEAARQRSSQLLLDMEAVAHTGSYEADLTSGSFYFSDGLYRLFGEAPQAFVPTLARIDARSHPDDAATVRQVLDEAVRTRQPYTYHRRIRRTDGEWRTLEAHGEVRTDAAGNAVQLRGLVQDITERVQAEAALHEGRTLLRATIDSSLDMVQVFEAVRDEQGTVVDFAWVLNNAAAERYYGDVIGQRLCQLNPGVVEAGIFDTFRQVLETGVPDEREHHYVHEQFDGWFHQSTVKLGDGVTTTTHDITARKQAEQELRDSKKLLQDIIDAPNIGLAVYKAVRTASGEVIDFAHEYINRASVAMLGEDFTGKLLSDHGDNGTTQLQLFAEVLATGQGNAYVRQITFRGRQVWFAITNTPLDGDRLVHTWEDVTERKQAEAELISLKEQLAQQAQDRYHSLFHTMEEGVSILEMLYDDHGQPVDMRWVEVNPAFERITGLTDVAGKRTSTVVPTEQYWLEAYDSVVKTGKALRHENYHAGVQQWYRTHTSRIGGPESRIVANVFEDITEQKRHEAQQRQAAEAETFRLRLTDALGPLADAVAIQEAATRLARQHFGADRCYYCEVIDGQVVIQRDVAAEGLPSVAGTYPLANFAVLKAGRPLVVRDVRQEESVDENLRQLCVQQQVISYLDVPVIKNGQPVGVLCLVQSTPREWTADEAALAAEVAERAWAAVERARTEAALRASEERFRAVANLVPDLLWRSTPDSSTTWYNQRWYEYTGQAPTEATDFGWTHAIHPDDRAASDRRYRAAIATGQPLYQEHRIRSAQGEYRWFQVHAQPLLGEHGEITAWYGAATDIHAHKLVELRLRRDAEADAFRVRLDEVLRPLTEAAAIQGETARLLREWLAAGWCYYTEIDETGPVATVARDAVRAGLPSLAGVHHLAAAPEYLAYLRAGKVFAASDIREATLFSQPIIDRYLALGMQAALGIPLVKGGQLRAVLVVADTVLRDWPRETITLLQEVAERTWAAVERARAEAALRESEEKYRTLFETIDEGFSLLEMIMDAEGHVVDYWHREDNPAFTRMTGIADPVGKRMSELVPDLEPEWYRTLEQVQRTGVPIRFEYSVQELGQWYTCFLSRVGDEGSSFIAAVYDDVTERKRREANLAFLAEASEDLLRLTNLDDTLNMLGQKLAAHLGLAACAFAELSADAQVGVIRHGWHRADMPSLLGTYRMAEFVAPEVLRRCQAGELVVIRDVWADPLTDGAQYAALNIHSFVSIPLVRQGQWRFLLVVYRAEPHDWLPSELDLLQEITARMWARLERARAEEALRASELRLQLTTDLVPDLLWDSDPDGSNNWYNYRWLEYTGQSQAEALGWGWTDAIHPDDRETSAQRYQESVEKGEKLRREHRIRRHDGEYRWFVVNTHPEKDEHGKVVKVYAAATDIHESRLLLEALHEREKQQALLLTLSDAFRTQPDPETIGALATRLVADYLQVDRCYIGQFSREQTLGWIGPEYQGAGLPPLSGQYRFADFPEALKRLETGPLIIRDLLHDPSLSDTDKQSMSQLLGVQGMLTAVLRQGEGNYVWCLTAATTQPRDWTEAELALLEEVAERTWLAMERARTQEALAASEQRLRALIANLPGAAAFVVGADLRYQLAGGEALDTAGLGPADLLGRTIAEAMPPELVLQHEAHYRQALAGLGFSLEHTAHGSTYITRGVPLLDTAGQPEAVLAVSYDITARKRAEEALQASEARLAEFNSKLEERVARRTQQLQASRDLLQSVLDTSLVSMSVMEAVRDEAGEVQDFRLRLVNEELARDTSRTDLVGKLYAQEYPGIRQLGIFDLMLKALATNQPQGIEYFYDQEGFNQWYACQFVKLGDGLVATSLDITERKTAEQERLKNLRLLEQAEAVAGLGSWDYDLATGTMRWSDGMYHLFDLPMGQPVEPTIYTQLAVAEDRLRAEQLLEWLTSGSGSFEATLRLQVAGQVKTVRLKAVVLYNEASQPERVLGVDLDISQLQRLEADNLRLRLGQQQALFEAVQEAQEEERRRMSESLHNGIGQILYATKLQLDLLPAEAEFSPHHRAAALLSEAIRQTRALSHELTPAILEEFGLEATLRSMCSTLSTPALRWHCHLVLDEGPPLPPSLQLAAYRLAQELAQNVLKHAHATDATLEVEVLPAWVVLRVEDNGRGFDLAQTSDGLGLRTLRSRVALLGGTVRVTTALDLGTQCQVRLPLLTGAL